MKGRGLFLIGTLLLLSEVLFGQDRISVTGYVTEKDRESVIGAAVVVKEETIGAIIGSHGSGQRCYGRRTCVSTSRITRKRH